MYDRSFFERQIAGSLRSAELVVPLIFRRLKPRSVVDVGCGAGAWLSVFQSRYGCAITGVDGAYVPTECRMIDDAAFAARDLGQRLTLPQRYDLALCLEVAEHLPEARSVSLVKDLTRLSDKVVFSAAVPGQGGDQHINEQPLSYWEERFQAFGYRLNDCFRPRMARWSGVEWWYRRNLVLFEKTREVSLVDRSQYALIHINAKRKANLKALRSGLSGLQERPVEFVNGANARQVARFSAENPHFKFAGWTPKMGEAGNFMSHFNCWKALSESSLDALLVFEDDCLIDPDFLEYLSLYTLDLPPRFDVFSVFAHANQFVSYASRQRVRGSKYLARAYQDWSTLCYLVSRRGAAKMMDYVNTRGADEPTDWFIFHKARRGLFKVYTLVPGAHHIAHLDGRHPTMVQNTPLFSFEMA